MVRNSVTRGSETNARKYGTRGHERSPGITWSFPTAPQVRKPPLFSVDLEHADEWMRIRPWRRTSDDGFSAADHPLESDAIMRDVVYYVAASLDGFIAHEDGSFGGFPWDERYAADLMASFPETFPAHIRGSAGGENKWFDVVIMGRKTYEVGLKEGITSPYPTLAQYVFSRTMNESPDENVTLVSDGAVETVRRLKDAAGKAIWLCGGAELASELFGAGLVDRLIIKLNPVVFGGGIPLVAPPVSTTALTLTDSKRYESGHIILFYEVGNQA